MIIIIAIINIIKLIIKIIAMLIKLLNFIIENNAKKYYIKKINKISLKKRLKNH